MKNDQVYLKCTFKGVSNSRMFEKGKLYNAYDNGYTYHVIDEFGHVRVVSKSDMRFMIENDGYPNSPVFAYFELEK